MCVCVIRGMPSSCRSAGESECGVGQVRLCVCVCVSYEECRVVVGLLERLSVWCWAGPSMCVCHTRNASSCRSAGESECVVLGRSVCLCVCVIRGMPSSCRSAGEIECVVLCRLVCVCVSYEEC